MTFLTLSLAALSVAMSASPRAACPPPRSPEAKPHVFTNTDLERMAACRYQTGAESRPAAGPGRTEPPSATRSAGSTSRGRHPDDAEADWRAQWRSIDQKTRRLRREAHTLRQEADEAPRDPKKRPTGRRSPSLLKARARTLEAEAKEMEDEFQARARRAGALPGWLRPKSR